MRAWVRTNRILVQIAFRNLFVSKARTLIVGGIILVGAMLVVLGGSLLDSIDQGMRGSVQGSLGGQLQVYSARSKDELALYGSMTGEPQLEPIEDFAAVKHVLEQVPEVKAVVPMGIDQAMIATGNDFDVALEKIRADVRGRQAGDESPALVAQYEAHKAHLASMIRQLNEELAQARVIVDEALIKERAQEQADLDRASAPAFWKDFDRDPLANLEFLENRIAPQSLSNGFTFIRYVGTDLDSYARAFQRFHVVEGTPVPKGQRGILLGKLYAEDWLKLKAARRLDLIKEARDLRHRHIDKDEELRQWVKESQGQTRGILLQLDPLQAAEATRRLEQALPSKEPDLKQLLVELFTSDDSNFERHYDIFYRELAPLLQLYSVRIGDTITVKAASKSGYMSSVNLKVYGLVEWRGLERSTAAGMMSLMDLLSWRELYGYMTPEKAAEIAALKKNAGAQDVSRENAEAELFRDVPPPDQARTLPVKIEAPTFAGAAARKALAAAAGRVSSQDEIEEGVALNAAVILRDPTRVKESRLSVDRALKAAHLDLKVVDWQKAAGMLGQFVSLARIILFTAVFFIFSVALVIINNAMVMATLQRVKEIGTLRAIGAQKRFVLFMLLIETGVVGVAFGALGALLGAAAVGLIRLAGGIPAVNDQLYFFFAGPSLMPHLGATSLAIALVIVLLVSVASGLYPALIATRVTPLEAMQSDE